MVEKAAQDMFAKLHIDAGVVSCRQADRVCPVRCTSVLTQRRVFDDGKDYKVSVPRQAVVVGSRGCLKYSPDQNVVVWISLR